MDFLLKKGPWKELFQGSMEGHPLEIFTNPDLTILVSLSETEGGKKIGMVIECFRVLHAKGELEAFVAALPKEALALIKHNEEETEKFMVVSSRPAYVANEEEKANPVLEELLKNLDDTTQIMNDVSSAYGLELVDIKDTSEETKESFFSQTLIMQFLSPLARKLEKPSPEGKIVSFGKIMLGKTKEGRPAEEPMSMFQKTIVCEGSNAERKHAMHLLIEGCMLSGMTAIVFDFENLFAGIATPSENAKELQKSGVDLDPMGFPAKHFFAGEQLKIEISAINPKGFTEIFGFGENPASKKIEETMQAEKFVSIGELAKKISEGAIEGHFNDYQRLAAERYLKLVEAVYPNLFGEQISAKAIAEPSTKGIGRANILHLESLDSRAVFLVLDSVANSLADFFSKKGSSKETKAIVFLPNAEKFLSHAEENPMALEIIEDFKKIEKYGIGFAFETTKELDLQESARETAEARITMIKGNDAGIHLKNQKIYRVNLRP